MPATFNALRQLTLTSVDLSATFIEGLVQHCLHLSDLNLTRVRLLDAAAKEAARQLADIPSLTSLQLQHTYQLEIFTAADLAPRVTVLRVALCKDIKHVRLAGLPALHTLVIDGVLKGKPVSLRTEWLKAILNDLPQLKASRVCGWWHGVLLVDSV